MGENVLTVRECFSSMSGPTFNGRIPCGHWRAILATWRASSSANHHSGWQSCVRCCQWRPISACRPLEHELRASLLAIRLGERLKLGVEERRELLYVTLLRWIGCTSHAHELASLFGDDLAAWERAATIDFGRPRDVVVDILRHAGSGRRAPARLRIVTAALAGGHQLVEEWFRGSCEVAEWFAGQLGLGAGVQEALGHAFERWDGRGPRRVAGDMIPLATRIVSLAQDVSTFERLGGLDSAVDVARRRSGSAHDPDLVEAFCQSPDEFLSDVEGTSSWSTELAAEPLPVLVVPDDRLDAALRAVGEFADLKTPFMVGHSTGVADLAEAAARHAGLPRADIVLVRRVGP